MLFGHKDKGIQLKIEEEEEEGYLKESIHWLAKSDRQNNPR